ncbi:nicastrin [Impatiens glandulifera]|uniref:nicastrin n=1 Tax=Impatiens glandulifera TaxID=253017 RepID=UPI001FB16059|nr:nicastrin [Impatiens glandulifera]
MASKLLYQLLCLIALFHLCISAPLALNQLQSVPDLEKSMYTVIDGFPCVRLLNIDGEIGCGNPGRDKVVAPVVRFKNADQLLQKSTVLLSLDEVESFFLRLSNDSNLLRNIGGVLVGSGSNIESKLKGFSPAEKFPQAEFSPYQSTKHQWNPNGLDILRNAYNFPVFLLSENSTVTLLESATKNEARKNAYTKDFAEFNLVMQTTKSGTHDSESCLKEGTCLPLGGYSVLSAFPALNSSTKKQPKPIILAVASMDSSSLFRDKNFGADSSISGLIALLAAIDALSHVNGSQDFGKQLVFVFFTGESWGYLGSRRFLLELDQQSDDFEGLNSTLIDTVLEIGSVGKAFNNGVQSFFTHSTGVSAATNRTLDAFQLAEESLNDIKILKASATNPGIPPSSLMTFLRKNPQTSGIILEDFDSSFTNKYYHSHLDDHSNVDSSAIVAAASLVARTLYILASGETTPSLSTIKGISVNSSLVEELESCLLKCDPGLSCGLIKQYISTTGACPSHYVGVMAEEPSSSPDLVYVSDISRFLWNFLAEKTSMPSENVASECTSNCTKKGALCIKSEIKGKGVCVVSSTRYVPAYSTRLKYEAEVGWKVLPLNSSDPLMLNDPIWTESFWATIGLRVYTVQDATYDRLVLLAGLAVTLLTYVATVATKGFIIKALKRD